MAKEIYLSTNDNPFDPSKDFDAWLNYDQFVLGYNTCGVLATKAYTSEALSKALNDEAVETAIDGLVRDYPAIYKKIVVEVPEETGEGY